MRLEEIGFFSSYASGGPFLCTTKERGKESRHCVGLLIGLGACRAEAALTCLRSSHRAASCFTRRPAHTFPRRQLHKRPAPPGGRLGCGG